MSPGQSTAVGILATAIQAQVGVSCPDDNA